MRTQAVDRARRRRSEGPKRDKTRERVRLAYRGAHMMDGLSTQQQQQSRNKPGSLQQGRCR